ncbi:uncharacterized protein LOC107775335 [Nicotiana tabacum]|uniref:Uncharacterized protein LOC107775335 n=1 Tax=Nicotiana tabacum TaxID=4097 RepID=A0AC58UGY2_TOBAC
MLENVMISVHGADVMPFIFGDFARDLLAQVKSLTVKAIYDQIKYFPTEILIFRNLRKLNMVLVLTDDFDIVKISPLRRLSSFLIFECCAIEDNKGSKRKWHN